MNEQEEYLTLDEAAKLLKVSRITIYRMVQKKQIPAVKIGKGWRISSMQLSNLFKPKK